MSSYAQRARRRGGCQSPGRHHDRQLPDTVTRIPARLNAG
jgi:hypothetical protein